MLDDKFKPTNQPVCFFHSWHNIRLICILKQQTSPQRPTVLICTSRTYLSDLFLLASGSKLSVTSFWQSEPTLSSQSSEPRNCEFDLWRPLGRSGLEPAADWSGPPGVELIRPSLSLWFQKTRLWCWRCRCNFDNFENSHITFENMLVDTGDNRKYHQKQHSQ